MPLKEENFNFNVCAKDAKRQLEDYVTAIGDFVKTVDIFPNEINIYIEKGMEDNRYNIFPLGKNDTLKNIKILDMGNIKYLEISPDYYTRIKLKEENNLKTFTISYKQKEEI
jgi:hypothetical protein